MKKKIIISSICLAVALLAVIVIVVYRNQQMTVSITVDRTEMTVGTQSGLGIHAQAHGRFVERTVELTPKVDGEVDFNKVGTYTVTITANYKKFKKTETVTYTVKDDIAPSITLLTVDDYYTLPGHQYVEEGFFAMDNYDGDLTDKVVRTEAEDKITYTVSDAAGNSYKVERIIVYSDPVPPVITLIGEKEITQERRDPYVDQGATAMDNFDGDLTDQIVVEDDVDTTKIGDYIVKYSVFDHFGNHGTETRLVHIIERTRPLGEEAEAEGKVVYLTFDDGPSNYTKKLLNVLDKYDVKATFFVCNGSEELIREEARRGHTVAVHSYTHNYNIYRSLETFHEDFFKMEEKIFNLTGVHTMLFRFPGGSSNTVSRQYCKGIMTVIAEDMTARGYHYFDWNVLSGDANSTPITTEEVYKNVINGISRNKVSVVLQHDRVGYSVDAVEDIIKWGLAHGYKFLPLDETSYEAHQRIAN